MRMFRKNILWIAIGNRNGCCSSVKNLFQKLTDLPPQHLMLNACRMALRFILSTARRRKAGERSRHPVLKGYNYQHIGDENVDSVRVAGLSHRVLTDIPRRPVKFSAKQGRKWLLSPKPQRYAISVTAMIAMA